MACGITGCNHEVTQEINVVFPPENNPEALNICDFHLQIVTAPFYLNKEEDGSITLRPSNLNT